MSKVFRAVGKVAGAVASIASIIPGGKIVAAIAGAVAVVSSVGANLSAKPPRARGNISNVLIGSNQPIPYVIGRTYIGGNQIHDIGYGGTVDGVPNPYNAQTFTYGIGPIKGFESFQADYEALPKSGTAITGYYNGFIFIDSQLGATPESDALAANWSGEPGWSTAHKLSGHAAAKWSFKFDKKGKVFAGGFPVLGTITEDGNPAYDPRLDSSYSGGSGSQRLNNRSTWGWTRNPALHAASYAYGIIQNSKQVFGVGLDADAIDWATVVAWANVCDSNGWECNGAVYEPDDRWNNIKLIAQAGSAVPAFNGGQLTFVYDAPRVSLDTITIDDLADDDVIVPGSSNPEVRLNGIVPKYRSEDNQWEMVQSALVTDSGYVSADGEERTEELELPLVTSKDQAARLAAYRLVNGREITGVILTCKPRLYEYGVGDCLTVGTASQDIEGLAGQLCVIVGRTPDLERGTVQFELITETAAKHAFALGQTGTAPPAPVLISAETRDSIAQGGRAVEQGAQQVSLEGNLSWMLAADFTGSTITSALPQTRRFIARKGADDVSSTTAFTITTSGGVSATVNNTSGSADRGTVTLGTGTTGAGAITINATFANGETATSIVQVSVANASMPSAGGAGATVAQDTTLSTFSSASTPGVSVTDELTVRSDGSGNVRVSFAADYTGSANVTARANIAYATSPGGSLTTLVSDTVGSLYVLYEEPGNVTIAEVQVAMPAANTDYYFKARMWRSGSGTVTPTGLFTVRQ